jgi:uncharacterized protein involved in exopolysaccharide biosynthesis
MFPFAWVKRKHKLNAIYETLLRNQELTVALQDQVAALTTEVAAVRAGLTTLAAAVDAEQAQVAAAIALLTADNPDVAAALVSLTEGAAELAAVKADVEATIPDAPPVEPTEPA